MCNNKSGAPTCNIGLCVFRLQLLRPPAVRFTKYVSKDNRIEHNIRVNCVDQ